MCEVRHHSKRLPIGHALAARPLIAVSGTGACRKLPLTSARCAAADAFFWTPCGENDQQWDTSMRQAAHTLAIGTSGKGLYECTPEICDWVRQTGIRFGVLTLFVQHTSASVLIQENADPDVQADLRDFFEKLAPESHSGYRHQSEGLDDMPAHIRSALTQTHLSIPVIDGRPALGTWQGIFLFEHRRAANRRHVLLHLLGE
jgi:secondary thiamine-phosphate synthase enzyme